MKEEIKVGVDFLREFLQRYGQKLTQRQIDQFASNLTSMLSERYVNHWYVDNPYKGQAFRCLRVKRAENYMDPVLENTLKQTKLSLDQLGLPNDFTLWIDPGEVSVRFGDSVGYTYTIARLSRSPTQLDGSTANSNSSSSLESSSVSSTLKESATSDDTNTSSTTVSSENNSTNNSRPTLIVQNSEQIFDDKLTAFIRQNSTSCFQSNECSAVNDGGGGGGGDAEADLESEEALKACEDDDVDIFSNDSTGIVNLLLSAEKRTISPPAIASSPVNNKPIDTNTLNNYVKRTNSSNIAINNPTSVLNSTLLDNVVDNFNSTPSTSSLVNTSQTWQKSDVGSSSSAPNSSSSSSNNNILNNNPNTANNRLSFNDSCYYSSSSSSCASSFSSTNDDSSLVSNLNWLNSNMASNSNKTAPGSDQLASKLLLNNPNVIDTGLPFLTNILPGQSYNHPTAQFATSLGFYNNDLDIMDTTFLDATGNLNSLYRDTTSSLVNKNYPSFYSESSSERSDTPNSTSLSSFFTAAPPSQSVIVNTNPADQLLYESSASSTSSTSTTIQDHQADDGRKKPPELKGKAKAGKKSPSPATSPSTSAGAASGQKAVAVAAKKEDSYCGYVESFPYYYKLNRLYNALALQKMQTERLKKSGLLSSNSPSAAATSPVAAMAAGLSPVNAVRPSKLISTSLASSPNKFNATSPSSTTPPPPLPGRTNNLQSPKNQHNKYPNNPTNVNKSKPNGYPMSPTNAAISFANHHKQAANKSSSSRQFVSTYPSQSTNLDYSLLQGLTLNQPPISTNTANNNSFFQIPALFTQPQAQQQQQQPVGHSFPSQGNTFSNSSFFTSQDLLKTGN